MPNTPARPIDFAALADFRYEIRRFLNFSEAAVRAAGIEPQQHQALLAIKGLPLIPSTTIGALAERLLIQHHSAVELSRRLEARGWILRSRSPKDAREVHLTPHSQGESILEKLRVAPQRTAHGGRRLVSARRAAVAQRGKSRRRNA